MRTLGLALALLLGSCLTTDEAPHLTYGDCGPEPERMAEAVDVPLDGSAVSMPAEDWRALQRWANAEHAGGACLSGYPASTYPVPAKLLN